MPFPFKDKELNKIAALFNVSTFLLTCAALVQPSWFRIKGLHCAQSLSLAQFFSFDNDDDDQEQYTIRQSNEYDSIHRTDFNGKFNSSKYKVKYKNKQEIRVFQMAMLRYIIQVVICFSQSIQISFVLSKLYHFIVLCNGLMSAISQPKNIFSIMCRCCCSTYIFVYYCLVCSYNYLIE